jgi:hypothetical protein
MTKPTISRPTTRRRARALSAAVVGLFMAGALGIFGGAVGSTAPRGHLAGPNFACVAVWDTGVCVGPPF